MADPTVTALREAASHRGFRLVASRKRTPGTGDYGKFGLTDGKGKPLLGVGDNGLTASASEIEDYLRGGELATWKKSAAVAPNAPREAKRAASQKAPEPTPRPASAKAGSGPDKKPPDKPARAPSKAAAPKKSSEPPSLRIRKATPSDTAAITKLLTSPSRAAKQAAAIAERIMQFGKPGNGLLVAERDKPIACLAWTLTPALHRPLSGRIATIIVDEKHRREGVGRALIEAAAALMAKAGCESVEAMSDIDIRSAHGFFRKLGFAETSYRFARSIAAAR